MNQKQRQQLLNMLLKKKEILLRDLESLQESSLVTDKVEEEGFTDTSLQSVSLGLLEHETRALHFIELAIRKLIDNENFGVCEECGGSIQIERLIAIPYASRCIECQSNREHQKNQNDFGYF
ncbi:MAG: TraR/DksA family transcriptional regulator [Planctomycetota bacterium]